MSDYPEKRPEEAGMVETFTFSAKSIPDTKADMELQIEAMEARLQNLVEKCKVQDNSYPIMGNILYATREPDELERLGKGLQIVATFIKDYENLLARRDVLNLAEKDPTWFAWAFGDFDNEIDKGINDLFEEDSKTLSSEE